MEKAKTKLINHMYTIETGLLEKNSRKMKKNIMEKSKDKYPEIISDRDWEEVLIEQRQEIKQDDAREYFYLEEIISFLGGEGISLQLSSKKSKEEIEKYTRRTYFVLFEPLNRAFKSSSLSVTEKLEILLFLIENNLKNGITKKQEEKEHIKLGDWNYFIDERELNSFLFMYHKVKEQPKKDTKLNEVVEKMMAMIEENAKIVINAHKDIQIFYFDKKETRTEKEIEKIIESFEKLGISQELCALFRIVLINQKEKEEKRKQIATIPSKKEFEKNTSNSVQQLDKKMIKKQGALYHEIMKYYDIDNNSPIRFLSSEEAVELISLLEEYGVEETQIEVYLRKIYKKFPIKDENVYEILNDYFEKIAYEERTRVKLNYIKECLQEMFIPTSDDDYIFWKEEFTNTMQEISSNLKETFTYEFERARKREKKADGE